MANAIVQATTHFDDAKILADVSKGLGAPMRGIAMEAIPAEETARGPRLVSHGPRREARYGEDRGPRASG